MENVELKKVCIKYCTCYYFNDTIEIEDFSLDNILIDEKSNENILIYNISYKTLIGSKLLRIRFDKIDRIIRIYNETRYLTLFDTKKYDAIYGRIRYLISQIRGIHILFLTILRKSKVDSCNPLPIEKTMTLYNAITNIKLF